MRGRAQEKLSVVAEDVWDYYGVQRHTVAATARRFGVSGATMRRFLVATGRPLRGRYEARGLRQQAIDQRRQAIIDKVLAMRSEGAIISDIAKQCDLTVSSTWRIIDRHSLLMHA